MAALQLAAAAVKADKLDLAASQLKRVAEQGHLDAARSLATLRLARVLAAQGQADQALQQLDGLKAEAYQAQVAEVRGDIYLRITSYNVCYTKLLRNPVPWPHARPGR